jgi:hypothetical protein
MFAKYLWEILSMKQLISILFIKNIPLSFGWLSSSHALAPTTLFFLVLWEI